MENIQQVDNLEVNQDLSYQQRSWMIQRIGWVVMALILIAALAGLFGGGPWSRATAGSASDPLWVEYPRFARLQAPTELHIHLGAGAATGNEARISIDRAYIERTSIQGVMPEPEQVLAGTDHVVYVFNLSEPDQPTSVTFFMQPEQIGRLGGRVSLDNGQAVSFGAFVYP